MMKGKKRKSKRVDRPKEIFSSICLQADEIWFDTKALKKWLKSSQGKKFWATKVGSKQWRLVEHGTSGITIAVKNGDVEETYVISTEGGVSWSEVNK